MGRTVWVIFWLAAQQSMAGTGEVVAAPNFQSLVLLAMLIGIVVSIFCFYKSHRILRDRGNDEATGDG